MANSNKPYSKKKIQDEANSGFGQYDEYVGGGGSPNPKKPRTHGHGVNSDHRRENNDTMQARTSDGKFTYKSVNGESIDPKYGPSRGKTVNPLLTGGKNGVMIEDVEKDFASQSGSYWNKYKDKWYTKGGEIVTTDLKTRVAGKSIWDVAKQRYDGIKKEFEGESHTFDETKKGRPGKEEKAAKQQVQSSGQEQAVINQSTGGIKMKPGVTFTPKPVRPKPIPAPQYGPTPVVPNIPGSGIGIQPTASSYAPKYSSEELEDAKEIFRSQFNFTDQQISDFDALPPKQKDDYIDSLLDVDEGDSDSDNSSQAPVQPNQPEDKQEDKQEDSEAIKKIKKMGFDGE